MPVGEPAPVIAQTLAARIERSRQQRARRRPARERQAICRRVGETILCVIEAGRIVRTVALPWCDVERARARDPRLRACPPGRRPVAPAVDTNALLDVSHDGTFSGARRAAVLGRQDDAAVAGAITRLAVAADRGSISDEFAGARIAALVAPPTAAAQRDTAAPVRTAAELAAERQRRAAGISDSAQLDAQAVKLAEACRPVVCFLTGDPVTGRALSKNTYAADPDEVRRLPNFLRFCSGDEINEEADPAGGWGEWFTDRFRRAAAAPPRIVRQLVSGAGPEAGAVAGAPGGGASTPPFTPGLLYILKNPAGTITQVFWGHQVAAQVAQGWTVISDGFPP